MFVEVADGEFIAVDTIAKVNTVIIKRNPPYGPINELNIPHYRIVTKRGDTILVSSEKGTYFSNVTEVLHNAK